MEGWEEFVTEDLDISHIRGTGGVSEEECCICLLCELRKLASPKSSNTHSTLKLTSKGLHK